MAKKIDPTIIGLGRPLRLYQRQISRCIEMFVKDGCYRSQTGGTLWAVLDYCHREGIGYTLRFEPGYGYEVNQK